MTTRRQRRFLFAHTGWTLVSTALLSSAGVLSLEYVFVLSFLGFAILTVLTAPVRVRPRWRSRLRWPLFAGTLVFVVLVGLQTAEKFLRLL